MRSHEENDSYPQPAGEAPHISAKDRDGMTVNGPDQEEIYTLIQRIKQGDREAFGAVTRQYQKRVFLLAYSYFGNRDDALDIVQETFLRLYQKAHMYHKGRNFQNWLLQIAKNLCTDFYRRNYGKEKGLRREGILENIDSVPQGESHDDTSSDIKDILTRCLIKLSERQRLIFVMKHYNQLQYSEIAQILNIALGTVKSLHFKAVQNLRGLMTPYMGGAK